MENLEKLRGKFITFEGPEGVGKSTQSKLLVDYLNNKGIQAVWTREPGGCDEAEEIRSLLFNGGVGKWDGITELLLMYASRRVHTVKKIKPLLSQNITVVSDRYFDSSLAYQGYGYKFDIDKINTIRKIVLDDFKPDITLILDLDIEEGLKRANKRGVKNKFEDMELDYHRRVREGFKRLSQEESNRCKILNVTELNIEEVQKKILTILTKYL